jgi:hypothetical protein
VQIGREREDQQGAEEKRRDRVQRHRDDVREVRPATAPPRRFVQGDRHGDRHHEQCGDAGQDQRVDHRSHDQRSQVEVHGETLDRIDLIREAGGRECDPAVEQILEKRDVLEWDRLVEPVLMVVHRPLRRCRARSQHDVSLVAGEQMLEDEHDGGHADHDHHRLQDAADEVSEHRA